MSEVVGIVIIGIGVLFDLSGVIGLIRLPDVYNRLQAATKCVTMGTCMILFGFFIYTGFTPAGIKAILTLIFILVSSPTAAHAIARASYKYGIKLMERSVCDLYSKEEIVRCSAIMNRDVTTILPDATLEDAISLIVKRNITGLPVVDKSGNLLGIITEKDIIDYKRIGNIKVAKVRDVMTQNVLTFSPHTPLEEVLKAFSEGRFRRVPIVENGKVVGIVSRKDIMRFLKRKEK
ncbi:MAG: hypothetical protein DRI22_03215 [Caldiserica bacterium]|nr:MAG: hypothetical protein DRI22_03215 [Caldisericota bacterium]